MKLLSAQDKRGLTVSKHCFRKNLMGHDSKEENFNGSSLTFVQFCWVMAHFFNFEKCGPTPSNVLFKGQTREQILRKSGLHCIDYWLRTWNHEKVSYYT